MDNKNHLWENNGILHLCELAVIGSRTSIVFTKCGIDVPANTSFKSWEEANCPSCNQPNQQPRKDSGD